MKCCSNYLFPIVLGLLLASCFNQRPKIFPLGDYQYAGYSADGKKIVEGQVSILSKEGNHVEGKWRLRALIDPEKVGSQVGEGSLEGDLDENRLILNLNPNMNDSNIILTGKIEGGRFYGTWSFDGFAGSMMHGSFEATSK